MWLILTYLWCMCCTFLYQLDFLQKRYDTLQREHEEVKTALSAAKNQIDSHKEMIRKVCRNLWDGYDWKPLVIATSFNGNTIFRFLVVFSRWKTLNVSFFACQFTCNIGRVRDLQAKERVFLRSLTTAINEEHKRSSPARNDKDKSVAGKVSFMSYLCVWPEIKTCWLSWSCFLILFFVLISIFSFIESPTRDHTCQADKTTWHFTCTTINDNI